MLKKYTKHTIIIMIQLSILAIIIGLIAPLALSHANRLNQAHDFFIHFHGLFVISHGLFYAIIYYSWPYLIHFISSRQSTPSSAQQISQAMHARYYLIGAFLLFELLSLLR